MIRSSLPPKGTLVEVLCLVLTAPSHLNRFEAGTMSILYALHYLIFPMLRDGIPGDATICRSSPTVRFGRLRLFPNSSSHPKFQTLLRIPESILTRQPEPCLYLYLSSLEISRLTISRSVVLVFCDIASLIPSDPQTTTPSEDGSIMEHGREAQLSLTFSGNANLRHT